MLEEADFSKIKLDIIQSLEEKEKAESEKSENGHSDSSSSGPIDKQGNVITDLEPD